MNPTIKPSTKSSRIHASIARTAPLTVAQILEAITQESKAAAQRSQALKIIVNFCEMVGEKSEVKVETIDKLAMSDGYLITLTHGYVLTWLVNSDKVRCKRGKRERMMTPTEIVADIWFHHRKEK